MMFPILVNRLGLFSLLIVCASSSAAGEVPVPVEPVPWECTVDDVMSTPQSAASLGAFCPVPWPEGVIYFRFESDVTEENRRRAREAMDVWIQADAGVVFLPHDNQPHFVRFANTNGASNSPVGVPSGGGQDININESLWGFQPLIVHELGHTIGFFHEQSRPDRDTFVEINNQNTDDDNNFAPQSCWLALNTPYDFLSIMHYRGCQMSSCDGCPLNNDCEDGGRTIVCRAGFESFQELMGNQPFMSESDREDVRDIYGRGIAVYVDRLSDVGHGTLTEPFTTFARGVAELRSGKTLCIREGDYSTGNLDGLLHEPMTIRGYSGSVVLTP